MANENTLVVRIEDDGEQAAGQGNNLPGGVSPPTNRGGQPRRFRCFVCGGVNLIPATARAGTQTQCPHCGSIHGINDSGTPSLTASTGGTTTAAAPKVTRIDKNDAEQFADQKGELDAEAWKQWVRDAVAKAVAEGARVVMHSDGGRKKVELNADMKDRAGNAWGTMPMLFDTTGKEFIEIIHKTGEAAKNVSQAVAEASEKQAVTVKESSNQAADALEQWSKTAKEMASKQKRSNFDLSEWDGDKAPTAKTQNDRFEEEWDEQNRKLAEEQARRNQVRAEEEQERIARENGEQIRWNTVIAKTREQANQERARAYLEDWENAQRRREDAKRAREDAAAHNAELAKEVAEDRRAEIERVKNRKRIEEARAQREANEKAEPFKLAALATQNILGGGGAGQKVAGATQFAASGLLGGAAKAAAGGPVGIAVQAAAIVYDVVVSSIKNVGQATRKAIQDVGEVSKAVVAGDGQKAFTTSVNSVADKLESFGIAGTMAAEGLRTFTAAVDVSREAVQAFANRGRELAAYNPAIAQARAEADVKLLLLDMKEATKFSAQYVKMIESEVRLNEAWRRSFEPVKARLMDFLANRIVPFMERVAKHVEAGVTKLDLMLTVMENLPKLLTGNFGGFQQAIVDRANELAGGINDDPGLKAGMAALEDWWIKAKQLQPAGHVRGPMQADPKLKLPIMER